MFYKTLKIFNNFSRENHGHGGHQHGVRRLSTVGFLRVCFHLRWWSQEVASVVCKKIPIFGFQRSKLDHLTVFKWIGSRLPRSAEPGGFFFLCLCSQQVLHRFTTLFLDINGRRFVLIQLGKIQEAYDFTKWTLLHYPLASARAKNDFIEKVSGGKDFVSLNQDVLEDLSNDKNVLNSDKLKLSSQFWLTLVIIKSAIISGFGKVPQ